MAKRVKFSDEVVEYHIEGNGVENPEDARKTLRDNREEENEDLLITNLGKRVLNVEDIEGQEEATDHKYGDIILTPFNLKEECEEGHFDKSGNFIFDKIDKDQTDAWLDSVDWHDVKELPKVDLDESSPPLEKIDSTQLLQNIISILEDNETIIGALKRFNRQRTLKKQKVFEDTQASKNITDLTEWADTLMAHGDIDIYYKTKSDLIKRISSSGDKIEKIYWFYKWNEDSQEYGPFESQQLLDWKSTGFFDPYVLCRQSSGPLSEYVRSDSIDFSQYI